MIACYVANLFTLTYNFIDLLSNYLFTGNNSLVIIIYVTNLFTLTYNFIDLLSNYLFTGNNSLVIIIVYLLIGSYKRGRLISIAKFVGEYYRWITDGFIHEQYICFTDGFIDRITNNILCWWFHWSPLK